MLEAQVLCGKRGLVVRARLRSLREGLLVLRKRTTAKRTVLCLKVKALVGVATAVQEVGLRLLVVEVMQILLRGLAERREAVVGHVVWEQMRALDELRALVEVLVGRLAVAVTELVARADIGLVNFDLLFVLLGVDGHKRSVPLLHVRGGHHQLAVPRRLRQESLPARGGLVVGERGVGFVVGLIV